MIGLRPVPRAIAAPKEDSVADEGAAREQPNSGFAQDHELIRPGSGPRKPAGRRRHLQCDSAGGHHRSIAARRRCPL